MAFVFDRLFTMAAKVRKMISNFGAGISASIHAFSIPRVHIAVFTVGSFKVHPHPLSGISQIESWHGAIKTTF
jgi:hypothetical protein